MEAQLDAGIELLGAVDLLGDGEDASLAGPDKDYALAWKRALASFRRHPAVKLNDRMGKTDPAYFQRKDLLLLRSAPPKLEFDQALSSCKSEAERSGAWEPWLAAMRDFARASRFTKLFGGVSRILKPDLDAMRGHLAKVDYVGKIERYTGLPFRGRYRILLSPLCTRGRGLNRVWTRDDGSHEIASILTPESFRGREGAFTDEGLDATLWHELCHGVMDMTVDLYDHEEKDTPLSLGLEMGHNCRNWLHGMREHLVRAVMLRLIAAEKGEKAASKQYADEEFSALPHLAAFVDLLKEYEASRRAHPTLADFYLRLRESFPRPGKPGVLAAGMPAGPFFTERQRERALEHLDLLLKKSKDERLVRRRAALSARAG